MNKKMIFVFVVVSWFGLRMAHAEAKAETAAIQELTEANIEQALAQKDSEKVQINFTVPGGEKKEAATEAEIPVQLESKKAGISEGSSFGKMMLGMLVLLALSGGAWFALRKYRFTNRSKHSAIQMKMLSQFHLGPKKSLAVIRVAGESILIGVTDHNISMIKSLSLLDEDVAEDAPQSFERAMGKESRRADIRATTPEDGEDFAITGIKDFVSSRLKNMRSLE